MQDFRFGLQHLIDVSSLSISEIFDLFYIADYYTDLIKNGNNSPKILENKLLINLFFENSTRTRSSFEIAAKNLGANVINIDVSSSSLKKGESEIDTILTLSAMFPNFITIRHKESGYVKLLSNYCNAHVINSGDGCNAHPTQALLDGYTVFKHKNKIKGLNILICGDILHSRVARSNIKLFQMLGAKISIVGPNTLMPLVYLDDSKIRLFSNLKEAVRNIDVIIVLRIQKERMVNNYIPSFKEYYALYGLQEQLFEYIKKDVLILHPGPINRNLEISSTIVDQYANTKILDQVTNGIVIRQAILHMLNNQ